MHLTAHKRSYFQCPCLSSLTEIILCYIPAKFVSHYHFYLLRFLEYIWYIRFAKWLTNYAFTWETIYLPTLNIFLWCVQFKQSQCSLLFSFSEWQDQIKVDIDRLKNFQDDLFTIYSPEDIFKSGFEGMLSQHASSFNSWQGLTTIFTPVMISDFYLSLNTHARNFRSKT